MALIIRPNVTFNPSVSTAPWGLSFMTDPEYWPASRTGNLVIYVPATNSNPVFLTVSEDETMGARVIFPGEVKVFGPLEKDVMDTCYLVTEDAGEETIYVSIDEVISE